LLLGDHDNSTWGDIMRGLFIRSLATTAVVGGVILAGAGVAVADAGRPTGDTGRAQTGGNGPDQPSCLPDNIDLTPDCFLSPHGGRLL
jgi:hypothetical protein